MGGFRKEACDAVRPLLKSPPGMTQELVDKMDDIFDRAGVARDDGSPPKAAPVAGGTGFRKEMTDLLRPSLTTPPGMTQELVQALDGIWDRCGVARDGGAPAAGTTAAAAAAATPPLPGGTGLANRPAFLSAAKAAFGALNDSQIAGIDDILATCGAAKWGVAFAANALGTAWLETAERMQPVHEAFWVKQPARDRYYKKMYDITGERPAKARELGNLTPGDGVKYHGRGYPQTTGKVNYQKMEDHFGVPFVADPDLMLDPKHAAKVMVFAMETGGFTGQKLGRYLPTAGPGTALQHKQARQVINGRDRWDDLSSYAMKFQAALQAGGWG